jgi:hypothetical protein
MKIKNAIRKAAPHVTSLLMLGIYLALLVFVRNIDDLLINFLIYSSAICLLLLIYIFKFYYLIAIFLILFFLLPAFDFPYFLKYYGRDEIEKYNHVIQNEQEIYIVKYRSSGVVLFEKNGEGITCTGKYKHLNGYYCRKMFESLNNFILSNGQMNK